MADHHGHHHGNSQAAHEAHAGVDHAGPTGVDQAALKRGHELDTLQDRPVYYFGVFLILLFVTAFSIVTGIFTLLYRPGAPTIGNEKAIRHNHMALDQRLDTIAGPADPKVPDRPKGDQPRLDLLDKLRADLPESDPLADPRAEFASRVGTSLRLPNERGNSPDYHPEELRGDRYPDLQKAGKDRMPINEAIKKLAGGGSLKAVEKAGESVPTPATDGEPKESNAGQPSQQDVRTDAHKDEHKKEGH
jgi:hypothetical protein